jgi:indole-3-glycerol phosphate synthase
MILDEIAQRTKERIQEKMKYLPLDELKKKALNMETSFDFPFEQAFFEKRKHEMMGVICEVKKASPSKGVIAKDFPYVQIAKEYEAAGATAISVLTEPFYFQGADSYLEEIVKEVTIPVLRKDFTVDEYMIYEAKIMGASAVLLICAILTDEQLQNYYTLARNLGLSALIETHDEEEVKRALRIQPKMIGVNNRDLKTFQIDMNTSIRLRDFVENSVLFISESGMKTKEDIDLLRKHHCDGVLIGETFMRSDNKQEMLQELFD